MKITLLSYTPNPERVVAAAAKLCYAANATASGLYEGLDDQKAADFVEMLASFGHESPIEHVSFTFGIEWVSRAFLAQITRHRIASFSVQSQRYVKKDGFAYITPPEVLDSPEALSVYEEAMRADLAAYNRLADILQEKHCAALLAEGKSEKEAKRMAEKKAIEDARFVLPNACDTQMIITMNARSLYNFFRHRCCNRAQWEIRAAAEEMLRLVSEVAPTLFRNAGPSCYKKGCSEGKMSCGQAAEMRCKYTKLHSEAEHAHQEGK